MTRILTQILTRILTRMLRVRRWGTCGRISRGCSAATACSSRHPPQSARACARLYARGDSALQGGHTARRRRSCAADCAGGCDAAARARWRARQGGAGLSGRRTRGRQWLGARGGEMERWREREAQGRKRMALVAHDVCAGCFARAAVCACVRIRDCVPSSASAWWWCGWCVCVRGILHARVLMAMRRLFACACGGRCVGGGGGRWQARMLMAMHAGVTRSLEVPHA